VASGIGFDLNALTAHPATLTRVPIFLAALLAVRGLPAVICYRRIVGTRGSVAAGLLQATSLPLIVAATQIGVATNAISETDAAAFVAAGLLSTLAFPVLALRLLHAQPEHPQMNARESSAVPGVAGRDRGDAAARQLRLTQGFGQGFYGGDGEDKARP